MKPRQAVFAVLIGTTIVTAAPAADLDGAGVGEAALSPLWRNKDPGEAAKLAMKAGDELLAAAAFGAYLRQADSLTSDAAIDTITRFSKKTGMRDRAAFMLAFSAAVKPDVLPALLESLASASDTAAHELAAATLATFYCRRYTSDPAVYASARNDLRGAAPALENPAGKGRAAKPRVQRGALPGTPDALFVSGSRDAVILATVAAAFSGDAALKEQVMAAKGSGDTFAGAMLLYLARQQDGLPGEQAGKLWHAATSAAPRFPLGGTATRFQPMLPGGSLACMGLAELRDRQYLAPLVQALGSRDERLQVDAVRAIRKLGPDDAALAAEVKLLSQAEWPVVVELCAALGAHPDKRVIPALINRLGRETGRLRLDLVHALSAITGEQHGSTAQDWSTWWRQNEATFEVDPAASARYRKNTRVQDVDIPSLGFFYGLPIYSDRLVFVVDTSRSMGGARIASLRENLLASLDSLDAGRRGGSLRRSADRVYYNIVDFGGDVVVMESGGLTDDIAAGKKRTETMPLTLGTRSYDALERGMELDGCDTVYFLSDGAPLWGQLQAWQSINTAMDLLMLYEPVAVWSVAFDPGGGNEDAMKQMADENYGKYEAPAI